MNSNDSFGKGVGITKLNLIFLGMNEIKSDRIKNIRLYVMCDL
jgi:hypothetical protein